MEPEIQAPERPTTPPETPGDRPATRLQNPAPPPFHPISIDRHSGFDALLIGPNGLRAGWIIAVFVMLYRFFSFMFGAIALSLYPPVAHYDFSPVSAFVNESVPFAAMLMAITIVGLFERRSPFAYNLTGPRRSFNFLSGMIAGFLALSLLVGALALGGWLRFGPFALSGMPILKFAALWASVFLLVAGFEEGLFRCFLLFTLTRSLNFWWALAIIVFVCCDLLLRAHGQMGIVVFIWMEPLAPVTGNGLWGVFAVALLGFFPCLALLLKKSHDSSFWYAVWVTSTLFGFIHTGNNGENWIGIFAAAAIGFVFCVSVWVTGSAWWAIGCHIAWDWAETYFYGTADSGLVSKGHFLSTTPAGKTIWSGGTDGPEGSLLVIAVISLLLVALLVFHGRKRTLTPTSEPAS